MSAEERVIALLDVEPDLHALMLAVNRAWAARYQPEAESLALYAWPKSDAPPTRVMIRDASSLPLNPVA